MGMEIWFSVFTHNRFNLVKGFCSKFKLFERASHLEWFFSSSSLCLKIISFPSLSLFLLFDVPSKQSPPSSNLPPFFSSATVSFEPPSMNTGTLTIFVHLIPFFPSNSLYPESSNNVFRDFFNEMNLCDWFVSRFHFFSTMFQSAKIGHVSQDLSIKIIIVFASLQYFFFHSPCILVTFEHSVFFELLFKVSSQSDC